MNAEREGWLDSLRGITISLVILNHCVQTTAAMLERADADFPSAVYDLNNVLGLVRMPAFFLCSGILFAIAAKRGWGWFIKKRLVWTVWIAALWGWLSISLISSGFHLYPWNRVEDITAWQMLLIEPTGVLWFVYAIAISGVFCMAVGKFKPAVALTAATVLSFSAVIAVERIDFSPGFHLVVWNLGVRGLLFFTIGFVFSRQLMKPRRGRAAGFMLALSTWAACAYLLSISGDAKDYYRLFLGIPATFAAIYVLQYVLARFPLLEEVFGYLGGRSLELFLLHQLFVASAFVVLQPMLPQLSGLGVLGIMFSAAVAFSIVAAEILRKAPGNLFFAFPSDALKAPRSSSTRFG